MNKIKSYIYEDIKEEFLKESGYFESGEFASLSEENFIDNLSDKEFSEKTKVIYFSGSFGFFHEGHLDVIKRAHKEFSASNMDIVIVVSPSNSDYAKKKYGDTNFANNFDRYQRILEFREELKKYDVVIDLNPMLNNKIDYNFTDILYYFLSKNINKNVDDIKNKPVLIGGKDRDYSKLNDLTNKVRFRFYKEKKVFSTSAEYNKKNIRNNTKKELYLRVNNKKEYDVFYQYMSNYYEKITPIYIENEKKIVKEMIKNNSADYITICKDYADILKYVKVSREYENPLSKSKHKENRELKKEKGKTVIDSDIYTGGTKMFVEQNNLSFFSILDLSKKNKEIELLDIDDFKKEKFGYPYVDISSKCSLPPFTKEMHTIFESLKKEIGKI